MNGELHAIRKGDFLVPDGWILGKRISAEDDTYTDAGWPGNDFWVVTPNTGTVVRFNLKTTGLSYNSPLYNYCYKCRVRIEFVGDGTPSTFHGGWLHHN